MKGKRVVSIPLVAMSLVSCLAIAGGNAARACTSSTATSSTTARWMPSDWNPKVSCEKHSTE